MRFHRLAVFSFSILLAACNSGSSSSSRDTTAPTLPTDSEILFSNIVDTTATATWQAATDDTTSSDELEYKVVISTSSEDIDTAAEVDDISADDAALDWTADTTTANLTDLESGATYFVAVLVRDAAHNIALYEPQSFVADSNVAPTATTIAFSSITSTTITAFWSSANDDTTSSADLEYKVVINTDATAIDTVDEADAISDANLLSDWTAGLTSIDISGLTASTDYVLAVLVKDDSDNKSLFTPQSFATTAAAGPVAADDLTIDETGYTTVDLSWSAATDDETAEADLLYKVVSASDYGSIDTIAEADAIETTEDGLVLDWTANTTTQTATDLTPSTRYRWAVLVKDEDDNVAIYTPTSATTLDAKRIFQATNHNANFGGVSGADDYCNSDINKPATGTYKALLVDGEERIACSSAYCGDSGSAENVDWVLAAETTYIRSSDDAVIGITTSSAIFDLDANLTNALHDGGGEIWTGMSANWRHEDSCTAWTRADGDSPYAAVGLSGQTNSQAIQVYQQNCDRSDVGLICVEQ